MERNFVMPKGAICDVPRCGKPATRAVIALQNPGHVYLCDSHWKAVTQEVMHLPDAWHDPYAEKEATSMVPRMRGHNPFGKLRGLEQGDAPFPYRGRP